MSIPCSITILLIAAAILIWWCGATLTTIYRLTLSQNGRIFYGAKLIVRSALLFAALTGLAYGVDLQWNLSKTNLLTATIHNLLRGVAWVIPVSLTAIGANLMAEGFSAAKKRRLTRSEVARLLAKNFFKIQP